MKFLDNLHSKNVFWYSFEAHITDEVERGLTTSKTESLIVPGGCTKYTQALDLVWNKPFKANSRILK